MTTFTIREDYYSSLKGKIYKNLRITNKSSTAIKVISGIITILAIIPIILVVLFGPILFLGFFGTAFISIIVLVIAADENVESTVKVYNNDGMIEYKDELSKSVAHTLVNLAKYEEEIKASVDPDTLYNEVFDKMNKYQELVNLGNKSVAEKDLNIYHKNMKLLLQTCEKVRQEDLLSSTQVLNSTLHMMGELQKDK